MSIEIWIYTRKGWNGDKIPKINLLEMINGFEIMLSYQ